MWFWLIGSGTVKTVNLTDTEKKILILAMDRSAAIGEIRQAALKLIVLLRKRYTSGHDLIKEFEKIQGRTEVKVVTVKHDPYGNFVMPFGKYRGEKLMDVPLDYLIWILDNFEDLRESTRTVIQNYVDQ
jgi:Putative quorum-sensing-regulated virulence factor